ncbi:MAG: hypothetical protein AB7F19_02705 [Candidatus Babeliales bacterium]
MKHYIVFSLITASLIPLPTLGMDNQNSLQRFTAPAPAEKDSVLVYRDNRVYVDMTSQNVLQKKLNALATAEKVSVLLNDGSHAMIEGKLALDVRDAIITTIGSIYIEEDGSVQITKCLPSQITLPMTTPQSNTPWHHGTLGAALTFGTGALAAYLLLKCKDSSE